MNTEYKKLSDLAYKLHSENNFDEAKKVYEKLLEFNKTDANVLNLYGMLCISLGEYDNAIRLLSQAFIFSKSVYVCTNLAKAYLYADSPKEAIKILTAVNEDSCTDDTYYTLAIAYKRLNDINSAIQFYKKTIALNPKHYNALYNIALIYKNSGCIQEALDYCKNALNIKQNDDNLYSLLYSLYLQNNNLTDAVLCLEKAHMLNPKQYLYLYNLGILCSRMNDNNKSIYYYKKVLECNPNHVQTLVNLSSLYRKSNIELSLEYIEKAYKTDSNDKNVCLNLAQIYKAKFMNVESISILENLLKNKPDCHEAYSLLASNYMDIGNYSEALANYNKALNLSAGNLNYLHGKSSALKYLGKYKESQEILEYIIKKDSSLIQSSISLGMYYLSEGNFNEGMRLYSLRSKETKFNDLFKEKVWSKSDNLEGKKILLYSDCGLGDTIMFARYIPYIEKKAKNIILATDKQLKSILKNTYSNITILSKSELKDNDYDIVMPIMNLPYALNMDFNNIPFSEGYIQDNKELTLNYSKLDIFKTDKKKIGLFWQGNKKIFKNRALKIDYINEIIKTDNKFYSFQLDNKYKPEIITSLNMYIKDYDDTASLLKNIDLLITVDSSIVHMAGALGVKTILLLPYTPEWRWFNHDMSKKWYKSVKIIKQNIINDWHNPIEKVIDEIK